MEKIQGKSFYSAHVGSDVLEKLQCDTIFTVLRDPLERVVSIYNYHNGLKFRSGQFVPRNVDIAQRLRYTDWLNHRSQVIQMNTYNAMVYQIAGLRRHEAMFSDDAFAILEQAKSNLDRCIVGFVDQMDTMVDRLKQVGLDVPLKEVNQSIKSKNWIDIKDLSHTDWQIAGSKLALDYRLYEYALRKFY